MPSRGPVHRDAVHCSRHSRAVAAAAVAAQRADAAQVAVDRVVGGGRIGIVVVAIVA